MHVDNRRDGDYSVPVKAELDLDAAIRKVPDFPKPGVLFYDITGLLMRPDAFGACIDRFEGLYGERRFDAIAAVEARGFLFAAPFAVRRGLPLILVRKRGKLPGTTIGKRFALEYGTDEIEVHVEDVKRGCRVLLMDDLIATGGTLRAAVDLLREAGAEVRDIGCVIGLPFLRYAERFPDVAVRTLIEYDAE